MFTPAEVITAFLKTRALKFLRVWGNLGFLSGSAVKNPPAMQEVQEMGVRSLSQEDTLEEGMATYSSILAWRIPWTEQPDGLQSIGSQKIRHTGTY